MDVDESGVCTKCLCFLVLDASKRLIDLNFKIFQRISRQQFALTAEKRCPFCRLLLYALQLAPTQTDVCVRGISLTRSIKVADCGSFQKLGEGLSFRLPHVAASWYGSGNNIPPAASTIDFEKIMAYIKRCDHGGCRSNTIDILDLDSHAKVLMIDVQDMCIVEQPNRCRYMALSYVWGRNNATFQTTTAHRGKLSQVGSLNSQEIANQLPLLVQDAIILTRQLGERYLWVDRLCIEQDNPLHKHAQLARMDKIFGQAVLTIVALSAVGSESPMSGVRPGTLEPIVNRELVCGAEINFFPEIDWPFLYSVYESRGWTYQERLLSMHCLYITGYTAVYHCKHGLFDHWPPERRDQHQSKAQAWGSRSGWFLGELDMSPDSKASIQTTMALYKSHVYAYTCRSLTYPSDSIPAFSGILSTLFARPEKELICGLPWAMLSDALLWGCRIGRIICRNRHYPTWSWAGWVGPIHWQPYEFIESSTLAIQTAQCDEKIQCPLCDDHKESEKHQESCPRSFPPSPNTYVLRFSSEATQFHQQGIRTQSSYLGCVELQVDTGFIGYLFTGHKALKNARYELTGTKEPGHSEILVKMANITIDISHVPRKSAEPAVGILLITLSGEHGYRIASGLVLENFWNAFDRTEISICLH